MVNNAPENTPGLVMESHPEKSTGDLNLVGKKPWRTPILIVSEVSETRNPKTFNLVEIRGELGTNS